MSKKKIGELLVDSGLITDTIVEEALVKKRDNQKIGDYLIEKGHIKEELMYRKLSEQLKIPLFRLSDIEIKQDALDMVDKDVLLEYSVFPVEVSGSLLTVAMENPVDSDSLESLSDILGIDVSGVFGLKSEILDYISKYYEIDESMSDIFGMIDSDGSDINEIQIADSFLSHLKDMKNLSIVILETNGNLSLKMGEITFLSKKDVRYLLDFIKKSVGYDDVGIIFDVLLKQESNKVRINLRVNRSNSQVEYWIEAFWLNDEDGNDLEVTDLSSLDGNGVYILLNKGFDNTLLLKQSLRFLQDNGSRVLVSSNDATFEKFRLNVLDVDYDQVGDYSGFADIFVFDYGWEIEDVSPLLRLIRDGKTVFLHTPFSSESEFEVHMEDLGISNLLNMFIKGYEFIK